MLVSLLALMPAACLEPPESRAIEEEAERFMTEYALDLVAHDVESIASRYDRGGAHRLFNAEYSFLPRDVLRAEYRAGEGPSAFEWGEMTFDALSQDAVLVISRFLWTSADSSPPVWYSYAAVLVRQNGALRIRLESETVDLSGEQGAQEDLRQPQQ